MLLELFKMSDDEIIEELYNLSQEERDHLDHLLWVVKVEEEEDPKTKKGYFDEFDMVYLDKGRSSVLDSDYETPYGEILPTLQYEISKLKASACHGDMERLHYLKKWVNTRFGELDGQQ